MLTPARRRPPSKIGCSTEAASATAVVGPLRTASKAPLTTPADPVSWIDGSRAAHQQLGGKPRADRGHGKVRNAGRLQLEAFGQPSDQHGERGEGLALELFERQQRGALAENGRLLPREVEGRNCASVGAYLHHREDTL